MLNAMSRDFVASSRTSARLPEAFHKFNTLLVERFKGKFLKFRYVRSWNTA